MAAALAFDVDADPEAVGLQAKLATARGNREVTDALVTELMGVAAEYPLFCSTVKDFC
ncbi:hypothetical protein [Corynebacterium deserti]|uniref:hypothetical protein n=1 Tax=Corynebacterium deserti TaxID=1408191 RepID=UPI0012E2B547|nr:hypothetical protein [Corynebacterium deserti]